MMHAPVQIKDVSLYFPHKICFENFSQTIHCGSRIAIIGRNGNGKSTLLKMLHDTISPTEGNLIIPTDVITGYVPQVIEDHSALSCGQKFQATLTEALAKHPNLLLLDEPTNHLDQKNRKSLLRMLQSYTGTLIIASHDVELLRNHVDTLWHIDQHQVVEFSGNYDDYRRQQIEQRKSIEKKREQLSLEQKQIHQKRMKEQNRSATSKAKGKKSIKQRKWPTVVSNAKADRAAGTSSKKLAEISQKRQEINDNLNSMVLPEIIRPSFGLTPAEQSSHSLCLSISDGAISYGDKVIATDIHCSLHSGEHLAICGNNGSGKSTLVKAILNDDSVTVSGIWDVPKQSEIGFLDQHYQTLNSEKTVIETIQDIVPKWNHADIRRHLNAFLFRKNEEVNLLVQQLSGGERARLCLAQIAAKPPRLLILDEVTNNLDFETREHIIQILKEYPSAMILISHDENFLQEIRPFTRFKVKSK